MEQILAFVLGIGIAAFVWVVVVVFKTSKKVEDLVQEIVDLNNWIQRNDEIVNRRMDQEIDRVNIIGDNGIKYTDSRIDKLESKILSVDKNGCEPTKKLIKG